VSLGQTVRLDLADDRRLEVKYDGRDIRAWELKHRKSALVESMSLTMLTWLGHHAAVRTGAINGDLSTYDAFDMVCVSVVGIRPEAEAEEEGPTKQRTKSKGSPKNLGADSSAP
jgi:hypothetical protein